MEESLKEKLNTIGSNILTASRNEIYISMRFLDLALSGLRYEMQTSTNSIGTDGENIYFHPQYLIRKYQENRVLVNRAYLHMLLHCIFRHLFWSYKFEKEEHKDYWNLSCDIAVEAMIDCMDYHVVKKVLSTYRMEVYKTLKKTLKVFTAEGIYKTLIEMPLLSQDYDKLCKEFLVDDHSFWYETKKEEKAVSNNKSSSHSKENKSAFQEERRKKAAGKWRKMSEKIQTNLETFSKNIGEKPGELLQLIKIENRERYDYRSFLKKFVISKEEMTVDIDTFDYAFYMYGLEQYKNMPLIEALEYKEAKKIEEFVIAIDTSGSCSVDMIQYFLEETFSILKEQESFYKKVNIHIIQCDSAIQSDIKITCMEELHSYMEQFEVKGFGGTDYTPVFQYVNELIEKKVFHHLKGMLYLTDGYGIYPKKRPSYEVAFLFLREDYSDVKVPPWAIKLILEDNKVSKRKKIKVEKQS